jgi:hypothetical protein
MTRRMTSWMRPAITVGYRVFVGKNMAYARLVAITNDFELVSQADNSS